MPKGSFSAVGYRRDFVAENVATACNYKDYKDSAFAVNCAVNKDRRVKMKDRFKRKEEACTHHHAISMSTVCDRPISLCAPHAIFMSTYARSI